MNSIVIFVIVAAVVGAAIGYFVGTGGPSKSVDSSSQKDDLGTLYETSGSGASLSEKKSPEASESDEEPPSKSDESDGGDIEIQSSVDGIGDEGESKEPADDVVLPTAPDRIWFIERRSDKKDKAHEVDEFPARIGRHPYSAVQLSARDISRIHFRVHRDDDGFVINPLKTRNPTILNHEELPPNEPQSLEAGDQVLVGGVTMLEFRLEKPELGPAPEEEKKRGYQHTARTALAGGDDWRSKLEETLKRHDGRVDEAAEELEMKPDALEKILDQMGLSEDSQS